MSWFDAEMRKAMDEGVRLGLEQAWTDQCDGRDDPEDRCPMNTADGCACYYRAYHEAPFWRRWRMDKPLRPPTDAVFTAMVRQHVEANIPLRALASTEDRTP